MWVDVGYSCYAAPHSLSLLHILIALLLHLYWIEGRCRPVIQISLAYLCWIEGPCRPVIQNFIAYLYCIIIAYLRRGGLIGQAS